MGDSLLNGISSYLMAGQAAGMNFYTANPYLSGLYSANPYLSGLYSLNSVSGAGVAEAFQSGVRFGQALEKAAANNPESAKQLQKVLEEAFGSQNSKKTTGNTTRTGSTVNSSVAAVYEPSRGSSSRPGQELGDYLAGLRASRARQRQSTRRH